MSNSKKPWYDNGEEWDTSEVVETDVVLRLSEKFDIALELIWQKLGYESLNEYINYTMKQNIDSQMAGLMDLKVEQINEVEKQIALIDIDKDR